MPPSSRRDTYPVYLLCPDKCTTPLVLLLALMVPEGSGGETASRMSPARQICGTWVLQQVSSRANWIDSFPRPSRRHSRHPMSEVSVCAFPGRLLTKTSRCWRLDARLLGGMALTLASVSWRGGTRPSACSTRGHGSIWCLLSRLRARLLRKKCPLRFWRTGLPIRCSKQNTISLYGVSPRGVEKTTCTCCILPGTARIGPN